MHKFPNGKEPPDIEASERLKPESRLSDLTSTEISRRVKQVHLAPMAFHDTSMDSL